jgi:hypothetical protein
MQPSFGERPINTIGPADIRRWQAHLASNTGYPTLTQCRSLVLRILQFAVDEGAIEANPIRKVPSPRRRVDPDQVLDTTKRRALTPEEAGRLLAQFPMFWWDHVGTPEPRPLGVTPSVIHRLGPPLEPAALRVGQAS